jgi:hypothetical protein
MDKFRVFWTVFSKSLEFRFGNNRSHILKSVGVPECTVFCTAVTVSSLSIPYVSAYECIYLYTHVYVLKYRVRKNHKLLLQNYITTYFDNLCDNNLGAQKRQQKVIPRDTQMRYLS